MLKRIITTQEHPVTIGRGVEQGKIMMTLNDFAILKDGRYVINTTSYLIKEDVEAPVDAYIYQIEGFDFYKIKLIDGKTTIYSSEQVQGLFQNINKEILLTGDFTQQLSDILSDALLLVVAGENTYNIGGNDNWEFLD